MKIFLCLPETPGAAADNLEKRVGKNVSKSALQVFRNAEDLAWMLRRPWSRCDIAILAAATTRELDTYITLLPLLKDVKILLVLPDREPATALKGHKLYPRFFSYMDSDPNEILAVLKKMIRKLQSQKSNRYKEAHDDTGYQDNGSGC